MFQDSDLKQYLDHCGNLMSMHNVKVRGSVRAAYPQAPHLSTHLFSSSTWEPTLTTRVPAAEATQTFMCMRACKVTAMQGLPGAVLSTLPYQCRHTLSFTTQLLI